MPYQKQKQQTLRQFKIIKRLYTLEKLQGSLLAKEYDVSARTLLRDMQSITQVIPLIRNNGIWSLDVEKISHNTTQLTDSLMASFAKNVDIHISCFEKSNLSKDKVAFAIEYRHLPKLLGEKIITAIENEQSSSFSYVKSDGTTQRRADSIKLYTENGRWYMIARDHKDNKVKTFLLSRIKAYKVLDIPSLLTPNIRKEADEIKSVWTSSNKQAFVVKLYVHPEIQEYITDMKLHKTQEIVDRHYDGGLEVHCNITHKLELLPAIKSWLPHIHILEPKWLWEDLMKDLEYYKDEDWKMDV